MAHPAGSIGMGCFTVTRLQTPERPRFGWAGRRRTIVGRLPVQVERASPLSSSFQEANDPPCGSTDAIVFIVLTAPDLFGDGDSVYAPNNY